MSRIIVIATKNPGKIKEIREVLLPLGVDVTGLADFPPIPEPLEDQDTFEGNSRLKALYYAKATGQWCLADDSGLMVDAIGGEPGVQSARYAAEFVGPDAPREVIDPANNKKLLEKLKDVPDSRRTARFVCHLTLASPKNILIETSDTVEGKIGYESAGENGFGYDPLFYLPERNCTTAQLPSEEKNKISHRGKALQKFARELKALMNHSL